MVGPAPHIRGAIMGNLELHLLVRPAVAMAFGRHQEFLAQEAERPGLPDLADYKHICDFEPDDLAVPP